MLTKGSLAIQFSGGLESKQDAKQVPTTKLLDLQNAVFTKQTTISKRNGYEALGTQIEAAGAEYTGAVGLAKRGDELLLFTDERCYSYRESENNWADADEVHSVVCEQAPIARTGRTQNLGDSATNNGVTAVCWEEGFRSGLWVEVLEDASGRTLVQPTRLSSSGVSPRVVACGEVLLVLYVEATLGQIKVCVINPADPTVTPTASTLTNDLDTTNPTYDAVACYAGLDTLLVAAGYTTLRPAVIAWCTNVGYRVGYLSPSGAIGAPVNGLPSAYTAADIPTGPIAVAAERYTGGGVAVVWMSGGGGAARQLKGRFHLAVALSTILRGSTALNLGSTAAQDIIRVTCEFRPYNTDYDTLLHWAAEIESGGSSADHVVRVGKALGSASTYDSASSDIRGHCLASRAWCDSPLTEALASISTTDPIPEAHVYVCVVHAVRFFPYVAAVRISADAVTSLDHVAVARLLPGSSTGALMRETSLGVKAYCQHLPTVEPRGMTTGEVYSRRHRVLLPYRIQLGAALSDGDGANLVVTEAGLMAITMDFDHPSAWQTAEQGRGLYLASSCPQVYDGNVWTEWGFHAAPDWGVNSDGSPINERDAAVTSNTGSGAIATGTYLYKFWYEWVDANGELHVGPTSIGVLVELTGVDDTVTLTVPMCRLTRKGASVRICAARSKQGATGDDDSIPFYRITSLDPSQTTGDNRFVDNDGANSNDTVTIVDVLDDATLATLEPLYTNGGILSNDPAPMRGDVLVAGGGRLFWTDPEDGNLVRFSQQYREDTAMEPAISLALRCNSTGGRITAIGIQDDAKVVFKENGLQVFVGSGPLADPDSGTPADTFSPPQEIPSDLGCNSPASVVAIPLGLMFSSAKGIMLWTRDRGVQLIGGPVEAYAAQTITRATQLPDRHQVLFLTSEGSSLLFDYEHGQWSRFTNHEGYGAAVVGGTYYYLRTDGRVFRETPGEYADDNRHIQRVIRTAWIKFQDWLQGWQRVHYAAFLGSYRSAHTLRVRYAIDYQSGMSAPFDIDVDADVSGDEYGEGAYGSGAYGGAWPNEGTVYQQEIHLNKRCQSISFEISDVEATDDFGASFDLSELLITGGVVRSNFKLPATRSQ